ncbi:hypothetical protein [Salinirubrum litoreum]|uniref:Uncharacterized protein n=1 Tax=Salinirubrum litoreum TaxID=1126234 RepID=A0ABD5RG33_9EURY|nr:hypothetical protein [Salinirubrum litoreum]
MTAVHVHVHFTMTGAFPLRMADLLFTDDALVVPEYGHLTPLFGIARGRTHDVAERAVDRYRADGVEGLVAEADRTHRIPYADLRRVRLYDGRAVARPKVAVDTATGPPYAYRIHAPVEMAALTNALRSLGERRGFAVDRSAGVGFDPAASVRRFLADR